MSRIFTQPMRLSELLRYEAPDDYSRDRVTVGAGEDLPMGAVVGLVTATGKIKRIEPAAADGSEVVAGVLLDACDATLVERANVPMAARHAIVYAGSLSWPTGISPEEQQAAIAQLKALGILVR